MNKVNALINISWKAVAILALAFCICFGIYQANKAETDTEARIEAVEKHLAEVEAGEWKECGMCGAHVHNWWWARNADNTEFVPVCQFCYQLIIEE